MKSRLLARTMLAGCFAGSLALFTAADAASAANCNAPKGTARKSESPKDIVETAVAAGQFKTLAAALDAAGLIDALKAKGPFTVFAPTDEAFAKLPDGTVTDLLKPENREKLVAILKYHVVSGRVTSDQVVKISTAKTLNGQSVAVSSTDGVKINDSKVIKADIETSNGVIHVIDHVLLPE